MYAFVVMIVVVIVVITDKSIYLILQWKRSEAGGAYGTNYATTQQRNIYNIRNIATTLLTPKAITYAICTTIATWK